MAMSVVQALRRGHSERSAPCSHTPISISIRPGIENTLNLGLRDCCARDPAFRRARTSHGRMLSKRLIRFRIDGSRAQGG